MCDTIIYELQVTFIAGACQTVKLRMRRLGRAEISLL
jgi:hypothetical protein